MIYVDLMKESQNELATRLAEAATKVQAGARYKHYKNLTYKVLLIALREEDCEPCVIYQAEYGERLTFIRPVTSWLESVEIDGRSTQRFTKISGN